MKKIIIIGLIAVVAVLGIILLVSNGSSDLDTPTLTAEEIYNKVKTDTTLPEDMVSRSSEDLDMRYGIDTTLATDYIFMANATSYYVDTIAIFKAEKAEDRETIKTKLDTIKKQAEDSMNNYDAEQYKIATNGEVYIKGSYVVLVMTQDTSAAKAIINENI